MRMSRPTKSINPPVIFGFAYERMKRVINLICETCQQPFQRKESVHNKNVRRGTKNFYCSIKCNPRSSPPGNELVPFNVLKNGLKRKGRAPVIDIDEQFLKELYDNQGGLCALTKMPMVLKRSQSGTASPYQVSVDRKDNDKDYSKDNVRLTCLIANLARNIFEDADVLKFCQEVTKNNFTDWDLINSLLDRGYIIGRKDK